jgi:hypothetical protein
MADEWSFEFPSHKSLWVNPSAVLGASQKGKNSPTPRVFSYPSASLRTSEWQTKELQPTELGRVYGRWKAGIPANLSGRYFLIIIG